MNNHHIYNIIIADDHEIVRSGLKLLINSHDNCQIIDEASSFYELIFLLEKKSYDLLILDLNLGDKNGMQSIEEIANQFKELKILVLSMYPEDIYAVQVVRAGALAYLNKKVISTELINVIENIIYKEKSLNMDLYKEISDPLKSLSNREKEVLLLIAVGVSNKEIAEKLSLSQKTISTYRSRILQKLSLSNTAQLIQFTIQHNILN